MPNPLQLIVLVVVTALLAAFFMHVLPTLLRHQPPDMAKLVNERIKQLEEKLPRYLRIEALAELIERSQGDPALAEQLQSFADELVAGALVYRIEQLARQHKSIMNELTNTHSYYNNHSTGDRTSAVTKLERDAAHVLEQLNVARQQYREFGMSAQV